jgi:hypothetical protein
MQCTQPEGRSILLQGRSAQQSPKASMLASETEVVELILLMAHRWRPKSSTAGSSG